MMTMMRRRWPDATRLNTNVQIRGVSGRENGWPRRSVGTRSAGKRARRILHLHNTVRCRLFRSTKNGSIKWRLLSLSLSISYIASLILKLLTSTAQYLRTRWALRRTHTLRVQEVHFYSRIHKHRGASSIPSNATRAAVVGHSLRITCSVDPR